MAIDHHSGQHNTKEVKAPSQLDETNLNEEVSSA